MMLRRRKVWLHIGGVVQLRGSKALRRKVWRLSNKHVLRRGKVLYLRREIVLLRSRWWGIGVGALQLRRRNELRISWREACLLSIGQELLRRVLRLRKRKELRSS